MNQGWSGISTISGRMPSGDMPEKRKPHLLQPILVINVDLEAMAVAFADHVLAVNLVHLGAVSKVRWIRTEPTWCTTEIAVRRALLDLVALDPFGHQADHGIVGRTEFARRGVPRCRAGCVPPRSPPSACRSRCRRTARYARARTSRRGFCPSVPRSPKPPGTRMPCTFSRWATCVIALEDLGVHPLQADLHVRAKAAVGECLAERFVRIKQHGVLADHSDRHLTLRLAHRTHHAPPALEIGSFSVSRTAKYLQTSRSKP